MTILDVLAIITVLWLMAKYADKLLGCDDDYDENSYS
jgi:hypothetical protein